MGAVQTRGRLGQIDRPPLHDLEAAIFRLVQKKLEGVSEDALSLGVELVADFFWLTDRDVLARVAKESRRLGGF